MANPPDVLRLLPPLQGMVSFELFGQAWVLFRDAEGRASCVLDECAHRACPLSVGRVVDGQIECPYHGAPRALLLLLPRCRQLHCLCLRRLLSSLQGLVWPAQSPATCTPACSRRTAH